MRGIYSWAVVIALVGIVLAARPAAAELSASSQAFVKAAFAGQQFQVLAGRMATGRSRVEQIISYGRVMAADAEAANEALADASADADDIAQAGVIETAQQQWLDRLYAYSGPTFDKLYVAMQGPEQTRMMALFKDYAAHGDDADLRAFVELRIPAMKRNLEHTRHLSLAVSHE